MSRCIRIRCVALALPTALFAQQTTTLSRPDAEFAEPFTQITTIRELSDGRVLVVDQRDRTVFLIDFKSNQATKVGRNGAGPGEYMVPGRLVALPADTSVLHDPSNSRYLIIKPDGTPGETFRLDEPVAVSLGGRGSVPRGSDSRGRVFFEGPPLSSARGGVPTAFDSVPVMRYDRQSKKLDTLAFVHLEKNNVRVTPGADRGGMSIQVGATAFPHRDDWTALPDGGIAVVRVRDYHVDRYSPTGARASGAPVRFAPVPVTDTEKEAWRAERRALAQSRSAPSSGISAQVPNPEWPPFKPPFEFWSTIANRAGEVWVRRSHKASEAPTYDVFNAAGNIVRRVAIPARSRVVGFGEGVVYVVRRDADDLEYLRRNRVID